MQSAPSLFLSNRPKSLVDPKRHFYCHFSVRNSRHSSSPVQIHTPLYIPFQFLIAQNLFCLIAQSHLSTQKATSIATSQFATHAIPHRPKSFLSKLDSNHQKSLVDPKRHFYCHFLVRNSRHSSSPVQIRTSLSIPNRQMILLLAF